jgi:hypothetical protein
MSATTTKPAAKRGEQKAPDGHRSNAPEKSSSSVKDPTIRRRGLTEEERQPHAQVEIGKAKEVVEPNGNGSTGIDFDVLRVEINDVYRRVEAAKRRSEEANREAVYGAIEGGEKLLVVKDALPYGQFVAWMKENFDGSVRTGQVYMRLAKRKEDAQALAHLGIEQVAAELATRKTSKSVKSKSAKYVSDWAANRGDLLHRVVLDMVDVAVVVERVITLAPAANRERLGDERDVMAREVREFLDHKWPTTTEDAPALFSTEGGNGAG